MAKPTHLDWKSLDDDDVIEPADSKKEVGWGAGEKPAHQYMNWLFQKADQWNKYLDAFTLDEGAYNVGISYNAGTFKLVQANGDDFTADEPGFIVMQSQTAPGRKVILEITAATHLFVDDAGASDILGEEFGTTAGVAWANARPFFLYAINADDTSSNLRFGLSPDPRMRQTPATANIGYHDNPMATPSDAGMFVFTSSNPTTTHDAVPCMRIGGIRMVKSASDDWTVQTLSENAGDGIRPDPFNGIQFTMPLAQMGAATGTFMHANGGTAPLFTTNQYYYMMGLDGMCDIKGYLDSDPGTDGAGAVTARIALPYVCRDLVNNGTIIPASFAYASTPRQTTGYIEIVGVISSVTYGQLYTHGTSGIDNYQIQNSDFSNGSRAIFFGGKFKAF